MPLFGSAIPQGILNSIELADLGNEPEGLATGFQKSFVELAPRMTEASDALELSGPLAPQ